MKIARICLGVCLALLCLTAPLPVYGGEVDAGFSVQAVIPENQRDRSAAYFDLETEPGLNQELSVVILNHGEREISVLAETHSATTNRNGVIHYSGGGYLDDAVPFRFSEIAEAPSSPIVVPPYGNAVAVVPLTIPEEPFSGMILGSIRLVKEMEEAQEEQDGVMNQFSYVIAVRLHGEDTNSGTDFALGEVWTELVNHKAAIILPVHNPQPRIVEDVAVEATVIRQNDGARVIQKSQRNVEMAPYSVFPMTLTDQEGYGFSPGEYQVSLLLEWEGERREFTRDLHIMPQESRKLNDNAVNQSQQPLPSKPVHGALWAVGGLTTALTVTYIIRKRQYKGNL